MCERGAELLQALRVEHSGAGLRPRIRAYPRTLAPKPWMMSVCPAYAIAPASRPARCPYTRYAVLRSRIVVPRRFAKGNVT
jgi:hypothetical protein